MWVTLRKKHTSHQLGKVLCLKEPISQKLLVCMGNIQITNGGYNMSMFKNQFADKLNLQIHGCVCVG